MSNMYENPKPTGRDLERSDALASEIRHEIERLGQPLPFAHFMSDALYHPTFGYYTAPTFIIGKKGDFTTAPEISPLFAQCFAAQCLEIAPSLDAFNLLEIGAGSGRFAYDLLSELDRLGQLPSSYSIYEISPSLQDKQRALLATAPPRIAECVHWINSLPQHFIGIVIANEVLDALPFHRFRVSEQDVLECGVTWQDNQFIWQAIESSNTLLTTEATLIRDRYALPTGYESEINLNLPTLIASIANSLVQGVVLFADYGYGQEEYYHPARIKGTMTCFYQHQKNDNPLVYPGLQDITAHVDFTRVIESAAEHQWDLLGYTTQAAFLLGCGLLDLANQQEQNLSAIDQVNFHHAIKLLTLPTEMGERIKIMALGKNFKHTDSTLLGFKLQDRTRDL